MKSRTLQFGIALAVASLCAQAPVASAAQGDWLVRGGLGYVDPVDDNLEIAPGTDLQVDKSIGFTIEGTYMFADHWGAELLAAWPFTHDVKIEGVGNVAEVDHLPPTLSLQYHFNPEGKFRPYVGVGVNYTTFTREREKGILEPSSELTLDDSVGPAAQVGLDIDMGSNWFANLGVRYIQIETDAEVKGSDLGSEFGTVKLGEVEINPIIYQAQFGYRFRRAEPAPAPVVAAAPPPPPAPVAVAPADADGDGVVDADDLCPDTPKGDRVGSHGCSCDVSRQVQFAFDSAELTAEGRATLDEMAETLRRLNFISGTVIGHTDSVGSDAFNQGLSVRRAESVASYLAGKGIGRDRLTATGKGESQPIADNGTDEGRALNRRVVITRTDCDAN